MEVVHDSVYFELTEELLYFQLLLKLIHNLFHSPKFVLVESRKQSLTESTLGTQGHENSDV